MSGKILIYGSYGYTGQLIVEEAVKHGFNITLAGRDEAKLRQQHRDTGLPMHVASIQDIAKLKAILQDIDVVIHCAGPFKATAETMVQCCLETQTHYVDITGEYEVFETIADYHDKAIERNIQLLPGAGFDVIPSDCLAAHLHHRLPSATHLQLAFAPKGGGGFSKGTSKTAIENLGYGSKVRENGHLKSIPLASRVLDINFGEIKGLSLAIPWGDIATAYRSTGIPNIEVYMRMHPRQIKLVKWSRHINWILRKRFVKQFLMKQLEKKNPGPSGEHRSKGKTYLWGRVWNEQEERVSRLITPDGYTLTATGSVYIVKQILSGNYKAGYQTPATSYGKDLITTILGTNFMDD